MLKEEFLEITDLKEIGDDEYRNLEFVYEELGNIDKEEFCTMYRNKDFNQLMRWCTDLVCAKMSLVNDLANTKQDANLLARFLLLGDEKNALGKAREILGTKKCILMKAEEGMKLSVDEIQYLKNNLD